MVFWVFGYGSLVWNPGFDYDEKMLGFIKDYRRVFDLGDSINSTCWYEFRFSFPLLSTLCLYTLFLDYLLFAACIDHRGTPENPARTCTLEEKEGEICVSSFIFYFCGALLLLFLISYYHFCFVFISVGSCLLRSRRP